VRHCPRKADADPHAWKRRNNSFSSGCPHSAKKPASKEVLAALVLRRPCHNFEGSSVIGYANVTALVKKMEKP
jgi:hypothetical protein